MSMSSLTSPDGHLEERHTKSKFILTPQPNLTSLCYHKRYLHCNSRQQPNKLPHGAKSQKNNHQTNSKIPTKQKWTIAIDNNHEHKKSRTKLNQISKYGLDMMLLGTNIMALYLYIPTEDANKSTRINRQVGYFKRGGRDFQREEKGV